MQLFSLHYMQNEAIYDLNGNIFEENQEESILELHKLSSYVTVNRDNSPGQSHPVRDSEETLKNKVFHSILLQMRHLLPKYTVLTLHLSSALLITRVNELVWNRNNVLRIRIHSKQLLTLQRIWLDKMIWFQGWLTEGLGLHHPGDSHRTGVESVNLNNSYNEVCIVVVSLECTPETWDLCSSWPSLLKKYHRVTGQISFAAIN